MSNGDRYCKGLEVYHRILGDKVHQSACEALKSCPEIERYSIEFMYGDIYARDLFDDKTKELIVISALITQQQFAPLKFHFAGALKMGITQEQLREVILLLLPVIGFPAATSAAMLIDEVVSSNA